MEEGIEGSKGKTTNEEVIQLFNKNKEAMVLPVGGIESSSMAAARVPARTEMSSEFKQHMSASADGGSSSIEILGISKSSRKRKNKKAKEKETKGSVISCDKDSVQIVNGAINDPQTNSGVHIDTTVVSNRFNLLNDDVGAGCNSGRGKKVTFGGAIVIGFSLGNSDHSCSGANKEVLTMETNVDGFEANVESHLIEESGKGMVPSEDDELFEGDFNLEEEDTCPSDGDFRPLLPSTAAKTRKDISPTGYTTEFNRFSVSRKPLHGGN